MKKADYLHRFIAKMIDFLIVGPLFYQGAPGILFASMYITISDGFFSGSSLGKKLVGLQVLSKNLNGDTRPCGFRESIIRNVLFGAIMILGSIPILGWFILLPIGIVLVAVETYFVYFDDKGIRIGDIFAATQVVDVPRAK